MKIALIAGGQPRFTPCFPVLMNQLTGFESADIYMTLWKSEWADNENTARLKIEKILTPQYNLAKIQITEEPDWRSVLPPHEIELAPPVPETITWWFKRGYQQFKSLSLAFDTIDRHYDMYIRFRLDGLLDRPLDLNTIKLENDVIFPKNSNSGFADFSINDQFAIGNFESMKFYCNFGNEYPKLIPIADPNWVNNGRDRADRWTWSAEHVIGTYMKLNHKKRIIGNFEHHINVYGRSKFTDKHYHHKIVTDPTERK